ncbi:hypothetical protein Pint_03610 [Pistacia integerrima]|uniref:Uncharacterized protein n=1 Tax=Pistacia integerrima TaxID=434235 RepID=A0ACC0Z5M1_9ROSI|nr:hypothetical protein Pint_03610 [Pistacia integerrima]
MAQPQETQDHQEVVEMSLKDEPVSATNKEEVAVAGDDLSLMLKIVKPENMEEDKIDYGFDSALLPKDFLRTCSECGKQFNSGKALGGHKRACLKKKNQPKLTIAKKVAAPVRVDHQEESGGGLNCYVCRQSFISLKSLYGHMRKHPEREWRGIQPPQPANDNGDNENVHRNIDHHDESYDGAAGSTTDLVKSLKTWTLRAKRGHRLSSEPRLSTSVSDDDDDDDDDAEAMQQAVNDLLLLAEHRSNKQLGSGYGVLKIKEDGVNKRTEILKTVLEAELGKKNKRCNSEETWVENDNEEDSEMELSRKTKQLKKKKRRLTEFDDMDCVNEEPITVMAPQTYSCPICEKVFGKHQALGGHVASHNKNKNNIIAKESSTSNAVSATEDGNCNNNGVENEQQTSGGDTEHQCNICSKIFQTGQALGGHKRCHWTGPAEAFSSSSQVTTSAGEVTQTTRNSLVLDFDLNDTPPEYFQIYGGETEAA